MKDKDWIDVKIKKPDFEKKVKVKLDNGEETIGFINDNWQRTCWLIKGSGGMFWRSIVNTVTHWQLIAE
jgi:hypothetical protein